MNYSHVQVVNYTPHTVNILLADGSLLMPLTSCGVARATEHVAALAPLCWDPFGDSGMVDQLDLVRKSFGSVTGLPEPRNNVMYVVSQIVADACPQRSDLLVPHDIVRNGAGEVLGCRGFARPRG